MAGISLQQEQSQRSIAQQIQYTALLHMSHNELNDRIEKELEENPFLEKDSAVEDTDDIYFGQNHREPVSYIKSNYLEANDFQNKISQKHTLHSFLLEQLALLPQSKKDTIACEQIIGSIDSSE